MASLNKPLTNCLKRGGSSSLRKSRSILDSHKIKKNSRRRKKPPKLLGALEKMKKPQ